MAWEAQWLARIKAFVAVVAAAAFCFAVFVGYSHVQRRLADRKIEAVLKLADEFDAPTMQATRSRVAWILMNEKQPSPSDADDLLGYFETVGYLTRTGYLDPGAVRNELSEAVRVYCEKLTPYIPPTRT